MSIGEFGKKVSSHSGIYNITVSFASLSVGLASTCCAA